MENWFCRAPLENIAIFSRNVQTGATCYQSEKMPLYYFFLFEKCTHILELS